jgi:hypothetical protein
MAKKEVLNSPLDTAATLPAEQSTKTNGAACVPNGKKDRHMEAITGMANSLATDRDSDVFLYIGDITMPRANHVIDLVLGRERRPSVLLVMSTLGGDAHAAYKIAKCFQCHYDQVTFLVPGYCKSAGTLVAIGATELVFSPYGELGPLDVQIPKKDELGEQESGWVMKVALDNVMERAVGAFHNCFNEIIRRSGYQITVRTAGKIATDYATGLFSPICQQINPGQLGSVTMALFIAEWYGTKLNEKSQNLRADGLVNLISGYPSHSLVIDQAEAEVLFERVRGVDAQESAFGYFIRYKERLVWDSNEPPFINFLSTEVKKTTKGVQTDENKQTDGQKSMGIASNPAGEKLPDVEKVRPGKTTPPPATNRKSGKNRRARTSPGK